MAWLWRDDDEFREGIDPAQLDRGRPVLKTHRETWFSQHTHLCEAAANLHRATQRLRELGFGDDPPRKDAMSLRETRELTWNVVREGETILLYHKRLGLSDWAYDFLHAHDLDEHWDRYRASDRIYREVAELVIAAERLLDGYRQIEADDERFLDFVDLPNEVQADFTLCRNLFSAGFDEMGVFAAGRGLEGVLRAIARRRNITKADGTPVSDARMIDLIESFARLQFTNGRPVVEKEIRSLLDYAREVRNVAAHTPGLRPPTARQSAEIIASQAQHLWETCKGARFTPKGRR